MISFISNWTKEIGITIVIVSILEMLIPNNKNKKYIRMVLGVFVIFNLISPIIQNKEIFDFDIENLELDNYKTIEATNTIEQTSMDCRIKELYEKELEKDIRKKLEDKGFKILECRVKTILNQEENEIERIELKVEKAKENETEKNNNKNDTDTKVENIVIEEIQKIKKVDINKENVKERDREKLKGKKVEEQNEETKENKLNKIDIYEIKEFIKKEYGVSEKCLKIN